MMLSISKASTFILPLSIKLNCQMIILFLDYIYLGDTFVERNGFIYQDVNLKKVACKCIIF